MPRKAIDNADGPYVGIIRRHLADKGFAFVQRVDDEAASRSEEYFLHSSGAAPGMFDRWGQGTLVTFYGQATEKGLRAVQAKEYEDEPTDAMQAIIDRQETRRHGPRA